ncbi:MAG: hypothetical protein K4H23_04355 [Mollicutes bacterium PWAP]|nr:hypothetical protein [Mollicutes bacterium PWAP]
MNINNIIIGGGPSNDGTILVNIIKKQLKRKLLPFIVWKYFYKSCN